MSNSEYINRRGKKRQIKYVSQWRSCYLLNEEGGAGGRSPLSSEETACD